jgi:hypothetical protein
MQLDYEGEVGVSLTVVQLRSLGRIHLFTDLLIIDDDPLDVLRSLYGKWLGFRYCLVSSPEKRVWND